MNKNVLALLVATLTASCAIEPDVAPRSMAAAESAIVDGHGHAPSSAIEAQAASDAQALLGAASNWGGCVPDGESAACCYMSANYSCCCSPIRGCECHPIAAPNDPIDPPFAPPTGK